MELDRRDALVALAGGVAATATVGGVADRLAGASGGSIDGGHVEQLRAVAVVVYPSEVTPTQEFIETYVHGRIADRDDYRNGMVDALAALDRESRRRVGRPMTEITETELNRVLRNAGVGTAHPVPDGAVSERIRYYVVNDLLYALYTTPVGGRLVDYENPDGYPGGTDAYQQGPPE